VFENTVLRRKFGPEKDEVREEWTRPQNEELNDLYSLTNFIRVSKSRRMRWEAHVERMGETRVAYRILVGKREGKRSHGRSRCRRKDNIKTDLQEGG
jgi:hypothetical protein